MNTLTRKIGIGFAAALLATTAIAPLASAREWRGEPHRGRVEAHHDGGNGAALAVGLGLAAVAGIALLSANQAPQPVYQPVYPAYPQPSYVQPAYAPPVYAQPAYAAQPNCTTINGAPACMGADGNWYYVR
jgi:hypothetical protein